MPRVKTKRKTLMMECAACHREFPAKRDDAQTCGPTCRQQLSRMKRAAREGKDTMSALKHAAKVECADCETGIDGRAGRCPVCHSVKRRSVIR